MRRPERSRVTRMYDYDLVAIGGGTGGLTVARLTAKTGKSVAVIERARPGGDCLWTGCVPTKALLASAKRYHLATTSAAMGVVAGDIQLDFRAIRDHIAASQAAAGFVDSAAAIAAAGVDLILGEASFVGPHTLQVGDRELSARNIVIATGGEPAIPPIAGLREARPDTNVEVVAWETLPVSAVIIGGGPIGIEFCQALTRFGVKVTVLEAADRILAQDEPAASDLIREVLKREGATIHTAAKVSLVERRGASFAITFNAGRGPQTVVGDRLVVATGRRPELTALRLDKAGVEVTGRGVIVDRSLRTSQHHIFAVGDVTGGYQFTHVAEAQARMVANILQQGPLGRRLQKWSDRVVPRVTYTDPEVASVGLTEEAARARHQRVRVWNVPLGEVDRAAVEGETEGYFKIITARGWPRFVPGLARLAGDEIVGASLAGPHAGDLLMPIVNAMKLRLPIGLVAWNMQAYPTFSLGVRQAAGLPFDS